MFTRVRNSQLILCISIPNNFPSVTGGAKIWECTQDLGEFLCEQKIIEDFANSKVLDLGCGAGILGILALQNGAEVHFQDYVS